MEITKYESRFSNEFKNYSERFGIINEVSTSIFAILIFNYALDILNRKQKEFQIFEQFSIQISEIEEHGIPFQNANFFIWRKKSKKVIYTMAEKMPL